jgi:hypothetical protein
MATITMPESQTSRAGCRIRPTKLLLVLEDEERAGVRKDDWLLGFLSPSRAQKSGTRAMGMR